MNVYNDSELIRKEIETAYSNIIVKDFYYIDNLIIYKYKDDISKDSIHIYIIENKENNKYKIRCRIQGIPNFKDGEKMKSYINDYIYGVHKFNFNRDEKFFDIHYLESDWLYKEKLGINIVNIAVISRNLLNNNWEYKLI